ncbi:hypothetical protein BJ508DRAFT_417587 [Ascobolus immersus RN42]|uniref:Uncharacterized protein n=1 Tax=Ascobolus immersus RN42 TaxID=1160509 RepID=A0A3N4HT39_ASCIM|nr:hypothetical protein BJ508DRAFT_417587 [Ascobolus immersus RN42]
MDMTKFRSTKLWRVQTAAMTADSDSRWHTSECDPFKEYIQRVISCKELMAEFLAATQSFNDVDLTQLHPNHMPDGAADSMPYVTYLKRFYSDVSYSWDWRRSSSARSEAQREVYNCMVGLQQMECFLAVSNHLIEAAKLPVTPLYDVYSSNCQIKLKAIGNWQSHGYSEFDFQKPFRVCTNAYNRFLERPFDDYYTPPGKNSYIQDVLAGMWNVVSRFIRVETDEATKIAMEEFCTRLKLGLAREEQLFFIQLWYRRVITEVRGLLQLWSDLKEKNDEDWKEKLRERAEGNLFLQLLKLNGRIEEDYAKHFLPSLLFFMRIRSESIETRIMRYLEDGKPRMRIQNPHNILLW